MINAGTLRPSFPLLFSPFQLFHKCRMLTASNRKETPYGRTNMMILISKRFLFPFYLPNFLVKLLRAATFRLVCFAAFLMCVWKLSFTLYHNCGYFRAVQSSISNILDKKTRESLQSKVSVPHN